MDNNPITSSLSDKPIRSFVEKIMQDYHDHLEMYAAAYLKLTDIPADQVVMKIQQSIDDNGLFSQTIWFERKEG